MTQASVGVDDLSMVPDCAGTGDTTMIALGGR